MDIFEMDEEIFSMLRDMRDKGYKTSQILNALILDFKNRKIKYPVRNACVWAFMKAFNLSLGQTVIIKAWHGWNSSVYGCNRSDDDLNRELDPLIHK